MTNSIFLSAVKKITEKNFPLVELLTTSDSLKGVGSVELSIQLYKLWLQFNPEEKLVYVAYFNLAALQNTANDLAGAKESLEKAIAINPDFFPPYINIGGVLEKLGAPDQGITQWSVVVNKLAQISGQNIRYKTGALKQIGRVLEDHRRLGNAEAILQQCLDIDPNQDEVIAHFIGQRLSQCKWPTIVPWDGVSRKRLMMGIDPLSMPAYTDDPLLQLATSHYYSKNLVGYPALNLQAEQQGPRRPGRLRIGYVSSDLREHAVGYLTANLFELHDRNKVEVFAYYCGVPKDDPLQARIKAAVEHWTDIRPMDDETAARRIAADGIDILVDLNGYTKEARAKVFAMRPAPVIVNWLGYPGSMGSPYHHYVIADDWVIPEEHEVYFSEKVLRLPCYQPNDRKRVIAAQRPSRKDANLPEDAFVFCCFNGVQKVNRFTFQRWMEILKRTPNSVLWMLDTSGLVVETLKDFAEQNGVSRDRLIFGHGLANPYHLARYPLADLFLDTSPYGAHTTASDALWCGVPVLTMSGRGFASRVCGSLIRSAGLPDLVCNSLDEYVERAVAFGNDPKLLQPYRDRLNAARDSSTLFDTEQLTRKLEGLYAQMQEDYQQGRLPIPDLRNLDVYHTLGLEEDHEEIEVMAVADYQAWYKEKLARRHSIWPITSDNRLWTESDIAKAAKKVPELTGAKK